MAEGTLLAIDELMVAFGAEDVVRGVDLSVRAARPWPWWVRAGSGKSVTALSVLGLLPYPHARHPAGRIRYQR
ncbi:MAG: hypothetical protein U5L11_11595 [Arhodomonas sp.]|nr:hypothetical protein [Arhodomonas sp.]